MGENELIYISGPITGVSNYRENFARAENYLSRKGYRVINPAKVDDALPFLDYEQHMTKDLVLLGLCETIYMLTGWENSKGANIEYQYAKNHNLKILVEE